MLIKNIKARQILDTSGRPTIECMLNGANASVPSGTSAGEHEAKSLETEKAIFNVNSIIAKKITGKYFSNQQELDSELINLDGTKDKSQLGANAILAVSMAFCKASAKEKQMQLYEYLSQMLKTKPYLPIPQMNLINSGKHVAADMHDIQEHMIMPIGAKNFAEAFEMGKDIHKALGILLKNKKIPIKIGMEHGFIISGSVEQRLDMLLSVIEERGYDDRIKLALDCAASEFYIKGKYEIGSRNFSTEELVDYYKSLTSTYPIISIEDGLNQNDFSGWSEMRKNINIQVVGDDLLTTNPKRIKKAIEKKSCNALILKPNQIGTVSEALNAATLAKEAGWGIIVSHRSRETNDTFLAHLADAIGDQCKFTPEEDMPKFNALLEIEKASKAGYAKFRI